MTRSYFIRSRLLADRPSLPWLVVMGFGFVGAPTFLRYAVDPVIAGTAFVTYYPFVLMAALFMGWKAAAGVAGTSAAVANYLFIEPRYLLFATTRDTASVLFFLLSSSLIILVVDTLRRAVIDLEAGAIREAHMNAEMKHLNRELQHRVKNSLTVVQALAAHTFRGIPGCEEGLRQFNGRLHALAEAQDVLVSGQWEHCRLPELAMRALAPFNGFGAVRIGGPSCTLPEQSCVPLVLALHELGTNALKHGALSSAAGLVDVQWCIRQVEGYEAGYQLVLEWVETGGPIVEKPKRRGLGSRLIAAQAGLDAVELDFQPNGLVCRIVVDGATLITTVED